MRKLALLPFLLACGGWADADTKSAVDSVRAQLMIEQICADDAGTCNPAQVRALERVSYCSNASMLFRHGQPAPDGGISCQPR
jgi:hypothetical protein